MAKKFPRSHVVVLPVCRYRDVSEKFGRNTFSKILRELRPMYFTRFNGNTCKTPKFLKFCLYFAKECNGETSCDITWGRFPECFLRAAFQLCSCKRDSRVSSEENKVQEVLCILRVNSRLIAAQSNGATFTVASLEEEERAALPSQGAGGERRAIISNNNKRGL